MGKARSRCRRAVGAHSPRRVQNPQSARVRGAMEPTPQPCLGSRCCHAASGSILAPSAGRREVLDDALHHRHANGSTITVKVIANQRYATRSRYFVFAVGRLRSAAPFVARIVQLKNDHARRRQAKGLPGAPGAIHANAHRSPTMGRAPPGHGGGHGRRPSAPHAGTPGNGGPASTHPAPRRADSQSSRFPVRQVAARTASRTRARPTRFPR